MHISTNVHMTGVVNASMTVVMDFSNNSLWLAFGWSKCRWQIKLKLTQTSLQHVISVFDLGVPLQPVDLPRYILQYSVFRIPYSVFRIPLAYSVFRVPYSVFRWIPWPNLSNLVFLWIPMAKLDPKCKISKFYQNLKIFRR